MTHPLLGCGVGMFPYQSGVLLLGYDAHSTLMTVAAETGLCGLLLMAWMVAAVLVPLFRRRHQPAAYGLWLGLIGLCVSGLTMSLHLESFAWFWFGCALGILHRDRESRR
jgi:O-antigen ligase